MRGPLAQSGNDGAAGPGLRYRATLRADRWLHPGYGFCKLLASVATSPQLVILRESGGSRTRRLLGSSISVSGILDHPHSRAMTVVDVRKRSFAISRRDSPEVCHQLSALSNQSNRAGSRPGARPASRLALSAPPPSAADGLDPVRSPVCWLGMRSVEDRAVEALAQFSA